MFLFYLNVIYARVFSFLPIDGVGSVWKSFPLTNT